jgi:hypothetical protein
MRPRRVARSGHRPHTCRFELRAPGTQELHLTRSGARPIEEVEEHEHRPLLDEIAEGDAFTRGEPHLDVGDPIADLEHARTLPRTAPALDAGEPAGAPSAGIEVRGEALDGLDLGHVRRADEEPLVCARPAQQQPAPVR